MRRLVIWVLMCLVAGVSVETVVDAQDEVIPFGTPDAMPLVDEGDFDIRHILLMGSAVGEYSGHVGLTDTIMLVSINADMGHVAVLSIPRDFYVHVPEMGNYKINQVYWSAERAETGSGIETLYETVLYNFGVEIDYHAIVNFDSFPALINSVGGIWITVDCAIRDWRLIEPDRD
ncbi:MAG: LCP family protein, partial [Chloroflexota bacterium]